MWLIALTILFHLFASVFLKTGAIYMDEYAVLQIISNKFYWLSIFFLFLQAITWQLALKKYSLNYAYMFTSLYYPAILIISFFVFSEDLTIGNILGTVLIVFGLILSKRIN
jgi:multidrug transporter EmrE-like cation transporter